ncbi:hypothetical protein D3C80_1586080 [compost metagenome]
MATYYKDQTSGLTLAENDRGERHMKPELTLIWDNRGDSLAFDIVRDGKRYDDYRGTTEGAHFAECVRKTAERFGFRYINARRAFHDAFPLKGDEQERLINAFERQGYNVRNVGAVKPLPREIAADWTEEAKPKASSRPIPRPKGGPKRVAVEAPALAYGM